MIRRLRWSGVRVGMLVAAAALGAAAGGGCGDGGFVEPPPSKLLEATGAGAKNAPVDLTKPTAEAYTIGSTVRSIEMIGARRRAVDQDVAEKAAARSQAGVDHARIRILPDEDPEPKLPPSAAGNGPAPKVKSQAQLVREAVARKPEALIVDPDDPADAELAGAVQAARDARIPVVVIGRPLSGIQKDAGGAPLVLVAPEPFAESARRLVALAQRNARNAGLNPESGAVLLIPPPGDMFLADRVAALREALELAGVSPVNELRVPEDMDEGAKKLKKMLETDHKLTMVFGFDQRSTAATNRLAGSTEEKRPYVQAGYTADETVPRMASNGEFAAVAEYVPVRLIRKAISVAASLAQGRSISSPVLMPILVRESPPTAGIPRLQEQQNRIRQKKAQEGL
ncbi:MAG: sugar ABC transporter substrate-binding protein [Isosphaeraceae bacterium]